MSKYLSWAFFLWFCGVGVSAKPIRHYVFFGRDREQLKEAKLFLETPALEGAQITYVWRQLEPQKDRYDFSDIQADLAFLNSKGKKLFIQLADVTFSPKWPGVPPYLTQEAQFNGGVAKQYRIENDDETRATVQGFMARRWDAAVRARWHKLIAALGQEFDGKVAGINFTETAMDIGETGRLHPTGFTFESYRDGVIANMRALKQAFPRSVALQYANFTPGEWQPADDKGYLRAIYQTAKELKLGVGGPDLLPYKPGQMNNGYHLMREASAFVPVGVAVQEGNYEHINPKTGKRVTLAEIITFATDYLNVDYIFWCTQEPFYSTQVIPLLKRSGKGQP